ncbi:MAG: DUF2520 domain-containing protein [Acidobacteriota bacterium]
MNRSQGLAGLRLSLLGAGRVGSSLAHWTVACGGELREVASGSRTSADRLVAELGGGSCAAEELSSADADLLVVAVSDDALDAVVSQLAARPQAPVVLHVSGSRDAGVLAPLRIGGPSQSACGSLHPLMAFPEVRSNVSEAAGIVFGVDGDAIALRLGERLAHTWGAQTVLVPPEARILYHYAATLAAGGVLTLLALGEEIAADLGLSPTLALGYRRLTESALEGARSQPAAAAITGPIARGDRVLVEKELAAAAKLTPEAAVLQRSLAIETLRHVSRDRGLTPAQSELLRQLRAEP